MKDENGQHQRMSMSDDIEQEEKDEAPLWRMILVGLILFIVGVIMVSCDAMATPVSSQKMTSKEATEIVQHVMSNHPKSADKFIQQLIKQYPQYNHDIQQAIINQNKK